MGRQRHKTKAEFALAARRSGGPTKKHLSPMHAAVLEAQGRAGNRAVGAAFDGSASLQALHRLMQRLHPELAPFLLEVIRGGPGAFSPAGQEAKSVVESAKDELDSLSEAGEMESLKLQMAMDRLSKMMSTLSNILKKTAETSSGIIGNLK